MEMAYIFRFFHPRSFIVILVILLCLPCFQSFNSNGCPKSDQKVFFRSSTKKCPIFSAQSLKNIFTLSGGQRKLRQEQTIHLPSTKELESEPVSSSASLKTFPSLLADRVKDFVEKNFFLSGAALSIVLAAMYPQVAMKGGLIKPELTISKVGVSCIFLLSGLSLRVKDMVDAITNIKLNALVQSVMFGVTPLYYYAFGNLLRLTPLNPALIDGVRVLGCLPCTVNMCIALTTAAGGNVASAICNAVLGNLLGVFLTPSLLYYHFGQTVQVPFLSFLTKLILKVLVPLAIGQTFRAFVLKERYMNYKKTCSRITDLLLISIVYATFCDVFARGGLGVSGGSLVFLMAILPTAFAFSQLLMFMFSKLPFVKLSRKDQVAAMFCSTQKTLAFGMPIIQSFFEKSPNLALISTPLLVLHPFQLLIGSVMVPYLQKYISEEEKAK